MKYRTTTYLFGHEYRSTIEADSQAEAERLIRAAVNKQLRIIAEPVDDTHNSAFDYLMNLFKTQ